MAPLKFDRVQAGEYQILDGVKMVGYIQKKSSSKWILYKCTNPSLLGNPLAVKKTLKELKIEAEKLIGSTSVTEAVTVKSPEPSQEELEARKIEIMREMLARDYVIDLSQYKQTEEGLEEVEVNLEATPTDGLVEAL